MLLMAIGELCVTGMGHVLDGGEVGRRVIGSDVALVVAEDRVHHPMQAVLNCPVAAKPAHEAFPQRTTVPERPGPVEQETHWAPDGVAEGIGRAVVEMKRTHRGIDARGQALC